MRRLVTAVLGLIAFGTAIPAKAADIRLPVKAPPASVHTYYNWTGFYIGGHVGYGWADLSDQIVGGVTASLKPTGMIYGGQVGFNYQLGSWVFGIEGEYSAADLEQTRGIPPLLSAGAKIDQIYNIAGRVGYAFDRTMIYGKFGGAWTQEEYNFTLLGGTARGTVDRTGWLLGIGIEYAFWGNWTAKLEYNYLDMGNKTVTLATTGGLVAVPGQIDSNIQTVKLGVNYRFGWGRF